jgi:hypothetical protein
MRAPISLARVKADAIGSASSSPARPRAARSTSSLVNLRSRSSSAVVLGWATKAANK